MSQNKVHRIRIDGIDRSKFEGRYVAMLALDHAADSKRFWVSEKQKNCLEKNLDSITLFAAFDCSNTEKGPRFIWASTDRGWLTKAFIDSPPRPRPEPVKPHVVEAVVPAVTWTEEDIPF